MKRETTQNRRGVLFAIFAFLIMLVGAFLDIRSSGALWLFWVVPLATLVAFFAYLSIPVLRGKYSAVVLWVANAKQYDSVVAYASAENSRALKAAAGWQTKADTYKRQLEEAKVDHPVQHKKGVELGRKCVVGEVLAQQTGSTMGIASVSSKEGKLLIAANIDDGSKVPLIGSTWLLGTRGVDVLHAVLEVIDFNGGYAKLSVVQVLNVDYMRYISTQADTYEFPSTLEITYRKFDGFDELRKDYSE